MTTTLLDRVVRWNLDLDGDLYGGDERERLRWYEGIATAASLQSLLIPWAGAIMVWPLGRPAVLPLAVILLALWLPTVLAGVYVRSRRVSTAPRRWHAKRILLTVLGSSPYAVFMVGALYVQDPERSTWQGAVFGALLGGLLGVAALIVEARREARREALAADDD